MHIGIIGLGKMGNNMRARLRKKGVEVTGYDPNPEVTDVADLAPTGRALPTPRVVWVMVPSGEITDAVIHELSGLLRAGRPGHRRRQLAVHRGLQTRRAARRKRESGSSTAASPAASGASRTATA